MMSRKRKEYVVFVVSLTAIFTAASDVRLPYAVSVDRYNISLRPYLEESDGNRRFTFDGKVEAEALVESPTDKIVFNAKNLNISKLSVCNGACSPVTEWKLDKDKEFLFIPLNSTVQNGTKLLVQVEYTGILNDELIGFYRSKYTSDGATKYIATTQMEATGARQAFPCLDEPDRKSIFAIEITCNRKYSVVSNMPLIKESTLMQENANNTRTFRFEDSLKMSTYLVAFVVHDFGATQAPQNIGRTPIQVLGRSENLFYSAETAAKVLSLYEKYFEIPFPLPKLDLAAIPDFGSGAMENWGLMTFRETALAYSPDSMDNSSKIWVTSVVSHELAHQWFGDLVTMKWWDDLWLNEAFAQFMEYKGLDHILPGVPFAVHFQKSELHQGMAVDALAASHSVSQAVNKPEEIDSLFDKITYQKGASLMRMLSAFLGEDTFQRGLKKYLIKYRYSNAIGQNLWDELSEQAAIEHHQINVGRIMTRWITKVGYPVVHVKRMPDHNGIKLSQSRFYLNGKLNKNKETWDLPITLSTKRDPKWNLTAAEIQWMTSDNASIEIPGVDTKEWFFVNLEQAGFYRVNYQPSMWRKLLHEDALKAIPPANRAQMVDDAMNLARGGLMRYKVALDVLIGILKAEDNYYVWSAANQAITYLRRRLSDSKEAKETLHELVNSIAANLFNKIMEEDDHEWNTALLRPLLFSLQCQAKNNRCLEYVLEKARAWKLDRTSVSPNLREVILCHAVISKKIVGLDETILEVYKKETNQVLGSDLRKALACSKDTGFLRRLLNESMSNGVIRKQDAGSVLTSLALNQGSKWLVWNYTRDNWDSVKKYLGTKGFARFLNDMSVGFHDEKTYSELQSRVNDTKLEGMAATSLKQAVETMSLNVAWKKKNLNKVVKLMKTKTRHLHHKFR